jgi:hypothetical protein
MSEPSSGATDAGVDVHAATPASPRTWLARWLEANAELTSLHRTNPMLDATVDEQQGRRIRIGAHWLADFASCNYLGFDVDPGIIAAVPACLARWGTHPSWSRMLASPALNERIDAELAALLGAEDVLTLPTITHISSSVLPALADQGTVYLDARAHKTIWDGAARSPVGTAPPCAASPTTTPTSSRTCCVPAARSRASSAPTGSTP